MMAFATMEEQDRAREEWFATRDQRRRERELKEEKRKEAEKMHRQWWGLDDQGRRVVKTEDAAREVKMVKEAAFGEGDGKR
jgi:COX assembly protein 1